MVEKKVYKLPQNVTPNRIVVQGQNIYYGNTGERKHGHTIRDNGNILYARTIQGKRLK